jgi:hypothetical protein
MREVDGLLAGVKELGLYRSVGTQPYEPPGWLPDASVISRGPDTGEVTEL